MAEGHRKRIGIVYSYNEDWIGGTYYIENLILSLGLLPDEKRPFIKLLIRQSDTIDQFKERVSYPYLAFVYFDREPKGLIAKINNLFFKLFRKNLFDWRVTDQDVDILFPAKDFHFFERITNRIYWIPDFQEKHLPRFFSKEELEKRDSSVRQIGQSSHPIIFSSETAANDFRSFYHFNNPIQVVHFAVHHPVFTCDKEILLKKYCIDFPYFIVCNQFWQHKNHRVIIDSLLQNGTKPGFKVVFTGKPSDNRKAGYYDELMTYARERGIYDYFISLGFIAREDQLALMKNSIAVIQPSLFEGWSTVVEDAKAMGKHVVLSDIPVHREQINRNVTFFDPNNPSQLLEILNVKWSAPPVNLNDTDYQHEQEQFATNFMNVINKST